MEARDLIAGIVMVITATGCASTASDPGRGDDPDPIEVTAVDYGYEGIGDTVPVGTELSLSNESDAEVHEIVLVELPEGEDRAVEDLAQLPEDEVLDLVAEHSTAVSIAPPGEDGELVRGDLKLDEPGRYALLCLIPTGADPDEFMEALPESDGPPDVDGGARHTVNGMWAELMVEG